MTNTDTMTAKAHLKFNTELKRLTALGFEATTKEVETFTGSVLEASISSERGSHAHLLVTFTAPEFTTTGKPSVTVKYFIGRNTTKVPKWEFYEFTERAATAH